jgi:predicted ester cyclase
MEIDKMETQELVTQIIESVFNQGNLDLVEELITPDFTINGQLFGRDGFRSAVAWWRVRFPDLHIKIEEVIAADERVGVWYTACGTLRGEFNGISSSGRKACWSGYYQFRIQEGRIADGRFLSDRLGIAHQLGAVLTCATAAD